MVDFDIIIIGSGIVGATAALALAKNTSLKIAVIDAKKYSSDWQSDSIDYRVSAISLASKRFFQAINAFEKMSAKRLSPYVHMHVFEEEGSSRIEFDCSDVNENELGFIIEDSVMRVSLHEMFSLHETIQFLQPIQLISLQEKSECIQIISQDNQVFSAKLLIGADGAHSWTRDQADIELQTKDYQHTAIVASVQTEFSHQKTAWQRFLKTGSLAFLPLQNEHECSIVWSTLPSLAKELCAQEEETFQRNLSAAFSYQLGKVKLMSQRYHFPLEKRHAKNYIKPRIALIGDAAHTLHPLAGQGVNLGLLDAAVLTQVIIDAMKKQRDFSSFSNLRRYERWRKSDNALMLSAVDVSKYLFMSEKKTLQTLRDTGVRIVNRVSFLKQFFANYAMGKRSDLPDILK